jgi:hypothetical protein
LQEHSYLIEIGMLISHVRELHQADLPVSLDPASLSPSLETLLLGAQGDDVWYGRSVICFGDRVLVCLDCVSTCSFPFRFLGFARTMIVTTLSAEGAEIAIV